MKQLVKLMLQLIGSEACGATLPKDLSKSAVKEELERLYLLSKAHDMAHIVGTALEKNELLEEDQIGESFRQQGFTAAYRYQQLQYSYETICNSLEKAKISYLPLKGAVIRDFYPEPWMRTSCDIDILVHEEDLDRAIEVLREQADFTSEPKRLYHDVSLYSATGIHLELHFCILENIDKLDRALAKVWDFSQPAASGRMMYRMTNEYFIFHILAHMAAHFINGGCGVKPFVDLYLLQKALPFDDNAVRALCRECEIEQFYDHALQLTQVWFADGAHTEITQKMEQYLIYGGVYGTQKNRIAAKKDRMGGNSRYILHRIFMPYRDLRVQYPVLNRHKWLLPICQVRRWFRMLFRGRLGQSVKELKLTQNMDDRHSLEVSRLMTQIGL